MKVTFCIPTYNRKNLVVHAIDSVLSLNPANFEVEIIVVDNDSTDGTCEHLQQRYSNKIFLSKNEKNLGPVGNWKKCLELADGDYVKFLFSDDVLHPEYLSVASSVLAGRKECVFFSEQTVVGFPKNVSIGAVTKLSKIRYEINAIFKGRYPVSPSMYLLPKDTVLDALRYRVDVFDRNSGWETGAGYDYISILESVLAADEVFYVSAPLVKVGSGKDSISISQASLELSNCYIAAKIKYIDNKNLLYRNFAKYFIYNRYCKFMERITYAKFLDRFEL